MTAILNPSNIARMVGGLLSIKPTGLTAGLAWDGVGVTVSIEHAFKFGMRDVQNGTYC